MAFFTMLNQLGTTIKSQNIRQPLISRKKKKKKKLLAHLILTEDLGGESAERNWAGVSKTSLLRLMLLSVVISFKSFRSSEKKDLLYN